MTKEKILMCNHCHDKKTHTLQNETERCEIFKCNHCGATNPVFLQSPYKVAVIDFENLEKLTNPFYGNFIRKEITGFQSKNELLDVKIEQHELDIIKIRILTKNLIIFRIYDQITGDTDEQFMFLKDFKEIYSIYHKFSLL